MPQTKKEIKLLKEIEIIEKEIKGNLRDIIIRRIICHRKLKYKDILGLSYLYPDDKSITIILTELQAVGFCIWDTRRGIITYKEVS